MGEFDRLYDKKKDQTYICKDSEVRSDLSLFKGQINYKINCVILMQGGDSPSGDPTETVWLITRAYMVMGDFSTLVDGSCIRAMFMQTSGSNYNLPVVFNCFNDETYEHQNFPVYRDRSRTESIQNYYAPNTILDFVWDKTNECFYLVGVVDASTSKIGSVKLSSDTQSTSESTAATSLAVKTVRDMISSATGVDIQVVSTLPTVDISTHTIYLVPKQTAGTNNVYDEYVNTDGTSAGWELIGDTTVDLSNYYTKTEADTLLGNKVDKVTGKGLSTEDYTTAEQTKLAGIATGAEVNVQADWNESDSSSDAFIKNKPSIPSGQIQSDWSQTNTSEVDYIKNKPTIPASQVNSDWNASSGVAEILNKPTIPTALSDLSDDNTHRVVTDTEKSTWSGKMNDNPTFSEASTRANIASGESFATILGKIKKFFTDLKTVAFTGSYNDLTDKPSIPSGQVQSDWSQSDTTAVDFIKNKPTIPAAQVNSDWNSNSGISQILHRPSISAGSGILITGTAVGDSGVDYEIACTGGALNYQSASLPDTTSTDYSSYSSGGYVSLSNASYKSVGTINLTAGTWIVEVAVRFSSNNNGIRFFGVSTTKNASSWGTTDETIIDAVQANTTTGGNSTFLSHTFLLNCTATTRFHIVAYHNAGSGTSLNVYPRVRYIKIRTL